MGCCSSTPVSNPATNIPGRAGAENNHDPYPVANPVISKPSPPINLVPNPEPISHHSNKIPDDPSKIEPIPHLSEETKINNYAPTDEFISNNNNTEDENKFTPNDDTSPIKENKLSNDDENKFTLNDDTSPIKENKLSEDEQESEKINNDAYNFCADGHTYKYRMDLVYFFMKFYKLELSSPIHIPCSQCQRIFSKPGFHCQVCNSILCDSCGSNSYEKNVVYCKRNHQLTWYVDSWAFNIEINKSAKSLVECNVCHKKFQEPAYGCRDCPFYSCIGCSRKSGVSPPINLLVCPNDHPLTLQTTKALKSPCGKCEKPISGSCYKCSDCEFAICQVCGIKNTFKMVRHAGLRCKRSESTMTLNDFRQMPNNHKFRCQGCYKHGLKFGMLCVFCGETFCLDCASRIQQHLEEDVGKFSNKGTMIEWYGWTNLEIDEKFNCSCCNENKSGIYLYDKENDKFCLECTTTFN